MSPTPTAAPPAAPPDRDESWRGSALCAQIGSDLWFPDRGGSTREAKAICRRCPVAEPCGAYALEHDLHFGVWGGLSETDRKRIRRGAGPRTPGCTRAQARAVQA